MTPRPYQLDTVAAVAKGWADGFRRQLIVVPTGGGKTLIFSWIAEGTLPQRTLILAHREELISQAIDKLFAATGIKAEKEKAECNASLNAKVVVASFQTMIRRLDKWPKDHFALVIADEAHHAISPSQQAVLKHFDEFARVLGVTATPDRGDKKNLGQYFDNIAIEIPLYTRPSCAMPGLIDQGFLSPITVKSLPLKIDLSNVRTIGGDFDAADLGSALDPYLDEIARLVKQHAGNRRILAFLPLIATSQKFVAACHKAGLSAEHVDGESEDRKEKLGRFASWEFDVLSNAMLLTEGYDDPSIDCVLILRATKSIQLLAQMVGRGTRIDTIKQNLLLFDFLWHHSKYAKYIARPAHLIAQSPEEAEIITELSQSAAMPADMAEQMPLDLKALAGAATEQREESLRKKLKEQEHKKGKFISAEEFALQHHNMEAAEFEPVVKWHNDAITDGQMKYLKRAHIDPETVRGKGHASVLLGVYFSSKKLTLASDGQRAKMRQMGHPNAEHATEGEARQFFAGLREHGAVRFEGGGGVLI